MNVTLVPKVFKQQSLVCNGKNSDFQCLEFDLCCSRAHCVSPFSQKVGQGHFINLFSLVKKEPEILVRSYSCVSQDRVVTWEDLGIYAPTINFTQNIVPLGLYKKVSSTLVSKKIGTKGLRVSLVYLFVTKFQTRFLHEIRQIIGDKGTKVNNLFF